jgi:hypothetical protein
VSSQYLAKYIKTPDERKRYTIDYSDWLDVGETVTDVAFAISNTTTPPLVVEDDSLIDSSTGVAFFVGGGDDGETYEVLVTIDTSGAQIKQSLIMFDVRELGN